MTTLDVKPVITDNFSIDIENLIKDAVSKGNIELLRELIKLRNDMKDEIAEAKFAVAITKVISTMPPIIKSKKVEYKNISYKYADLSAMLTAISVPLAENGIYLQFHSDFLENKTVSTTLKIFHEGGYSKKSTMVFPVVQVGNLSLLQAIAGTITYAKRYLLSGFLALSVDQDNIENLIKDDDTDYGEQIASHEEILVCQSSINTAFESDIISFERKNKALDILEQNPTKQTVATIIEKITKLSVEEKEEQEEQEEVPAP